MNLKELKKTEQTRPHISRGIKKDEQNNAHTHTNQQNEELVFLKKYKTLSYTKNLYINKSDQNGDIVTDITEITKDLRDYHNSVY